MGTHFGERFWRPALEGKAAEFLPNPDTPHTYHFIPDVASGLLELGRASGDALGKAWMLPCASAEPSRALVDRFARAIGREITLKGVPKLVRWTLGLVVPILREVDEMLHQWEVAFMVDDGRFRSRFGANATDLDAGAGRTAEWALGAFGARS